MSKVIDTTGVNKLFNTLTGKQQKKVVRTATRKAAQKLTKETKLKFRNIVGSKVANSRNWWNGKSLISGIKYVSDKRVSYKVHIMGDFRLKFWEMGTVGRYTKKKRLYRGIIKKNPFLEPTINSLEDVLAKDIKNNIKDNLIKYAQSR